MRSGDLNYLCCPACGAGFVLDGDLICAGCTARYPVVGGIPRFVRPDNYAQSFGTEWLAHARTQYDTETGRRISRERFFAETGWPDNLKGEVVIEAGCGSGRFTEVAADTGATVLSFDYSRAVEANYASNGSRENVLIVQADAYRMPFPPGVADRLFCFGVLQHTPDPQAAFLALLTRLRPGGEFVADVYLKSLSRWALQTKYWVRPLTRRLPPETLLRWTRRYVNAIWPVAGLIRRLPHGRQITWRLLIADYAGVYDLPDETLREWAVLDVFDMLSPRYDNPQTVGRVRRWAAVAGLERVRVRRGFNGVEIAAKVPARGS
jgi:SAM-dependent methyltransferase